MSHANKLIAITLLTAVFMISAAGLTAEMKTDNKEISPLIPMEDFYRNPDKTAFKLSPDGEYLAFLQPWKNRLNVHVQKIGEAEITRITSAEKRDIAAYMWANNQRILYVQDKGGDENFRAYAVSIDGSNPKELTPFEKTQAWPLDELKNNPDEMLIALNKRNKRFFDVYRININTGELKMIAENPGNVSHWLTDHDGKLRVAVTSDDVNSGILYREKESDSFKTIITTNFKDIIAPLFFTYDNKYLYVSSNIGRDKQAIFKYDIAKGKFLDLIFEHPEVDVAHLLHSDKKKIITGVAYFTEKRHYHFFDRDRALLQKELEKRLPGVEVSVASTSRDETKILVRTYSDKTRGAYYYFNRANGDFKKLVEISPWLDPKHMADQKYIKYTSRDGLAIPGYLTIPKGMEARNLPVVVLPHGGPWARDSWGYDPDVQFLANRGYAVLQMNFRGSTGYGRKFWESGFKRWGKEMQDDITDGVQLLIKKGIADPKRIGIYGASYGGYAVLAGLTFTPDLYACGVDYVGISNLFTILESIPPYWEIMRQKLYEMMGDPEKDKELLKAASPVFHVDKIKAPLFIAQGANDPRVKKSESDQMVAALKKRGIEVPYMVKDDEGHGFRNEENRFDFYRAMEKFLGKHLGGRIEKEKK